jgi:hypothetical protein
LHHRARTRHRLESIGCHGQTPYRKCDVAPQPDAMLSSALPTDTPPLLRQVWTKKKRAPQPIVFA